MTLSELLSKAEYYSLITDEEYKELKKQIQPCEDCISREEVLRHRHVVQNNDWIGCCVVRVDEITKLPSVTPSNDAIKEAYIKGYDYGVKDWFKSKTEPCEDCISRAKALEMLGDVPENWTDTEKEIQEVNDYRWFKSILEELPSVTPHPKMGKWIYELRRRMIDETDNGAVYREEMWCKCSECGADFGYIKNKDKYCKFCGAKMEVAE
jgi:hypothetical protein